MFSAEDWGPGRMMNGSYDGGMMSAGGWVMALFGLLLLVLVATTLYLAVRASVANPTNTGRGGYPVAGSPRDILDLRLARGEISAEEYASTRTLLGA